MTNRPGTVGGGRGTISVNNSRGGGSRRFLRPDFDPEVVPHRDERADPRPLCVGTDPLGGADQGAAPGAIKHHVSNALVKSFVIYLHLDKADDMELLDGLVMLRAR